MAVKIRLKRFGKIRAPYYRIVVADSRTKRDGRVIEEIGLYHPLENPSRIEIQSERAQYWLGVGAQPTEQVRKILELSGDWGTFRGEGDTESKVQAPEGKAQFVADASKAPVLKPKQETPAPAAEAPAEEPKAEEPAAEEPKAEEPAAEAKAEEPAAEAPAEEAKAEEPAAEAAAEEAPAAEAAEASADEAEQA